MSEEATEILKEIRDTLKHQEEPKVLFVKDIAKIMKMNVSDAGKLWNRPDFPRNWYRAEKSWANSI